MGFRYFQHIFQGSKVNLETTSSTIFCMTGANSKDMTLNSIARKIMRANDICHCVEKIYRGTTETNDRFGRNKMGSS